jgi:hypothetical protein
MMINRFYRPDSKSPRSLDQEKAPVMTKTVATARSENASGSQVGTNDDVQISETSILNTTSRWVLSVRLIHIIQN